MENVWIFFLNLHCVTNKINRPENLFFYTISISIWYNYYDNNVMKENYNLQKHNVHLFYDSISYIYRDSSNDFRLALILFCVYDFVVREYVVCLCARIYIRCGRKLSIKMCRTKPHKTNGISNGKHTYTHYN